MSGLLMFGNVVIWFLISHRMLAVAMWCLQPCGFYCQGAVSILQSRQCCLKWVCNTTRNKNYTRYFIFKCIYMQTFNCLDDTKQYIHYCNISCIRQVVLLNYFWVNINPRCKEQNTFYFTFFNWRLHFKDILYWAKIEQHCHVFISWISMLIPLQVNALNAMDLINKWRLLNQNEVWMVFSWPGLVSNFQTDMMSFLALPPPPPPPPLLPNIEVRVFMHYY